MTPAPKRVLFPLFDVGPKPKVKPMTLTHRSQAFEPGFDICPVCNEWCLNLQSHLSKLAVIDPLHAVAQVMGT